MKFDLSLATGNTFTGYGDGYVLVNGTRHDRSVIVLAERILPWAVDGFDTLGQAHFDAIVELKPEVLLLGTGPALRFPHPGLSRGLAAARIGFEVMDTQAACRTFNILVAEGRVAAAALIFERPAPAAGAG